MNRRIVHIDVCTTNFNKFQKANVEILTTPNFFTKTKVSKNFLAFFLFLGALVAFNGCAYLVVGGIGAVGGYAVSSDTVQGTIERDNQEVWEAASTVVNIMGKLNKESEDTGRIEAIINGARVSIGITQFTPKLVKLTVKARKSFFPSMSTAQSVYMKIIGYLGK